MTNFIKRFLALALAVFMVVGLMPLNVLAEEVNSGDAIVTNEEPAPEAPAEGEDEVPADGEEEAPADGEDQISEIAETTAVAKIGETGYETVEAAFAAATNGETVELIASSYEDVVIPAEFGGTLAIGTCTLNSITNNSATAKIVINGEVVVNNPNGSAITGEVINISGNGTLTAIAGGDHAYGIGGDNTKSITIENVHILKAQGGHYGEIGTDTKYYKDAPEGGAAIGSGFDGAVINLTNVKIDNALGGSKAAGIGARYWTGVTINIDGCTINNVEGGATAAGIGGSRVSKEQTESGTTINIKNSTITAVGGVYAAGIGSGYDTHCQAGQPICTINIDGSTINATGGKYAAGVGTGYHNAGLAGEIKNSTVTAASGEKVYKDSYTSAQDIGFGVADLAREGSNNDSYIVYNGTKITLPGNVAQIGETKYKTLADAITAAQAGDTIVLLSDVTLGEKLTISGNVTISGNATITRADTYTGTLFVVNAGATLTLDGGLTIDGGNNYEFNADLYEQDLESLLSIPDADSAKWFTPEAGAPVATAFMITTTGGTVNLNKVTIQNNYSTGSGIVSAGANSTITLTGATIRHIAVTKNSGVVANVSGANLNVIINEGTVIDGNHVGGNHGIFKIYSGAVLTMNGGEIKNTTGWNSNGTVVGLYGGTFIMNGGTICSNSSIYGPSNGRNAAIYLHASGAMEMHGGTICHNSGRSRGGIDSSQSSSKLTITGGSVLDNISLSGGSTPDIGGTVGTWSITGGTFTQNVSQWLAEGYKLVENENGTYGAQVDPTYGKVAEVNGKYFKSLAEALAAAQAGDTITFVADITEDVTISKAVTINGAGKTYTGAMTLKADTTIKNVNFDGNGYNGYAITTRGANYLTIEACTAKNYGYGFVQLASGTALTTVKNVTVSDMNYGVKIDYSNAVVLENVDITAAVAAVLNSNYGEKTVTIKNSKLNILGTWVRNNTTKTTFLFEGANTVGKFITEDALDNFKLAAGATLTAPEGKTVTTDVADYKVLYENGTYKAVQKVYVAQIGENKYESLADALAVAQDGDEVVILAAGTYKVPANKNITITGAVEGVKFDMSKAVGIRSSMTFNNVTFEYGNANYVGLQHAGTMVYNNCIFNGQVFLYGTSETFNNCTFNQNSANAYNVWTYGAKEVAFNNCTFNSVGKSVLIYAESASISNKVTVTGSTFNASAPADGKAAIEMDSSLISGIELTISNSTATGFANGNVSGNPLWNNKKGNNTDANNDITVVVDGQTVLAPVTFVAKIGQIGYTTLQAAVDAAVNGSVVTVLKASAENITVTQKPGVKFTIDGNEQIMTGTITVNGKSSAYADAGLTIKDFDFDAQNTKDACIKLGGSNATRYTSNVTVIGCKFKGADGTVAAIKNYTGGCKNLTVTSCTAKGMHSLVQVKGVNGIQITDVTIDCKNGIAVGTSTNVVIRKADINAKGYGIRADGTGAYNMTVADSIISAKDPIVVRTATGAYELTVKDSKLTGTSGYGVIFTAGDDGTYEQPTGNFDISISNTETKIFPESVYVAEVNGVKYLSLAEAIKACTKGETVKVLQNITYTEADVVNAIGGPTGYGQYPNPAIIDIGGTAGKNGAANQPSNVNAVIDLNGHTITNNAEAYLFLIMDNAKITFTGEGTVQGTTEAPLIWVTGTETVVTIESGKYTSTYGSLIWATHSGDLVIKGGDFSTSAEDASSLIMRNEKDRQNSKFFITGKSVVTVTGGTFHGFNPEKMLDDSKTPAYEFNAVAEDYKAFESNGVWTVKKCVVTIGSVADLLAFAKAVTGNTEYQGVKVAANTSAIVKLTADLDLTDSGFAPIGNGAANAFSGTFDGQNHTISNMTLSCDYYRGVGFFRNLGKGAVIKNLTFINANVNNGAATGGNHFYGVVAGFSNNLTLDNVDVKDSSVTCKYAGSAMVGCIEGATTVKNCDIENFTLTATNMRGSAFGIVGNSATGHSVTLDNNTVKNAVFVVDGEVKELKETLKYNEWAAGTEYTEASYVAQIGEAKYTTLFDAVAAAKDDDTITLIGDVDRTTFLTISKSVTINLNGKNISREGGTCLYINGTDITVTINGEGTVTGAEAVYVNAGTAVINGGTFNGGAQAVYVINNGHAVINGGTFSSKNSVFVLNEYDKTRNNTTITVYGGTFVGFNPENNAAEGAGTNFVADGYESVDNGDGTWTVKKFDYIKWVKAELLAGRSVKLDRDIVLNDISYVEALPALSNGNGAYSGFNYGNGAFFNVIGGNVTFDLNGHSITYDIHDDAWCNKRVVSIFYATDKANLTITDSVGGGKVDVYGMASAVYSVAANTKVTIEGGTWTWNSCKTCGASNVFLYASHGGELYITGGTFVNNVKGDAGEYMILSHYSSKETTENWAGVDYDSTKVEISGGTFHGYNPSEIKYMDNGNGNKETMDDGCAPGYAPEQNDDGTWTVAPKMIFEFHLTDKDGNAHWLSPLRSNDIHSALSTAKVWYDSLQGTYNFTLKILESCEIDEPVVVNFPMTIDLNGNTLTGSILVPDAELTVKNGSIVNTDRTVSAIEINAGKLTLENVNITSARHAVRIDGAVDATIKSGKFMVAPVASGTYHAVNVSGAANVTIVDGTFVGPKGTQADSGAAVKVQKGATVTIEGGNFSGGKKSTLDASGTLTVTGGTYNQDPTAYVAKGYEAVDNGNGTWSVVETVAKFDWYGTNLNLGNNLDMVFAFSMNAVSDWTGHYVEMVRSYADGTTETVTVPYADWVKNGKYYTVSYGGFAAKEMCDEIALTVYNAEGEAVSLTKVDSIRAYAMRMYDKATSDLARTAFVDLLNYGAAAQKQFNYGEDDYANALLSDEQKAMASTLKPVNNNQVADAKLYGTNVIIKSNIIVQMAFRGVTDDMYAVVEFTGHKGNVEKLTVQGTDFTPNGAYKVLSLENMVIADARCMVSITIYNADGSVYVSVKDSIESYVARNLGKSDLFEAFMIFADTAHAYLHSNDK